MTIDFGEVRSNLCDALNRSRGRNSSNGGSGRGWGGSGTNAVTLFIGFFRASRRSSSETNLFSSTFACPGSAETGAAGER